jgi:hypothetical protein
MKRSILSIAVTGLVLTLGSRVEANPTVTGVNTTSGIGEYHRKHGKEFSWGYAYFGREHRHWTSCYFDERFGCYLYFDPSTQVYYYWCERDVVFYPINHCPYETFVFTTECVAKGCPVMCPKTPPTFVLRNTIHPIINTNPQPVKELPPMGHGPVQLPGKTITVKEGSFHGTTGKK